MSRIWWSLLLAVGGALGAWAAPTGTVFVKRTGDRFDDVEWVVRGDRVEVKFKGLGSRYWKLDEVILVEQKSGGGEEDAEEGGAEEDARSIDWGARCRLSPADGWRVATPSIPLARIQLDHTRRSASLTVTVRPSQLQWDFGRRGGNQRQVGESFQEDLRARFSGQFRPRISEGEFFGSNAMRIAPMVVTELAGTDRRTLSELRFQRFGLDYTVSLVSSEDEATLHERADELFAAFSFLPPADESRNHYADYELGFRIERPGPEWQIDARPFEPTQPLRMSLDNGRAEIVVEVVESDTPSQVVQERIEARRARSSRWLQNVRVNAARLGGTPVERFVFEDFKGERGSKQQRFSGFAVYVQEHVLVFTGSAPLTDPDSRQLHEQIDDALQNVMLYDPDGLREQIEAERQALVALTEGHEALSKKRWDEAVRKLDDAIRLRPEFARAYYLRAQAKKGAGDFEGFREDLDRAAELDPDAGYDAERVEGYVAQAQARQRAGEFEPALELWQRAFRASKDEEHLEGFVKCVGDLWKQLSREDPHDGMGEIENYCRPLKDHQQVHAFLAKAYNDAANALMRQGEFSRAKRWASRLKRLRGDDRYRDTGQQLYDRIKQAEDRARGR